MALAADWVSPYGPQERAAVGRHASPSTEHWLGTDQDGFDVWARVIYGSRLSLAAGVVSMALAIAVGATAGIVAGYFGGWGFRFRHMIVYVGKTAAARKGLVEESGRLP